MSIYSKIFVIIFMFYSTNVNSALIDNGSWTTDDITGLDWLDLSYSTEMTYDEALLAFSGQGWRYATNTEVENLFFQLFDGFYSTLADGRSAGYPDAVYDNQIADITNFENLFGPSYVTYTQGSIPHTTYTYGLYRDETDILRNMGTLLVHINQYSYIYGLDNTSDWEGYQSVTFGTYLVRETVVPIPGAIYLLGSGIITLASLKRRKQKE